MKWIRVSERLPDLCMKVLLTDGIECVVGWSTSQDSWDWPIGADIYSPITHWMELPPLPDNSHSE